MQDTAGVRVMTTKDTHPIRRRDGDGLMLDQRRFISALVESGDVREVCRQESISWNRFKGWVQKDLHFQEALDRAIGPSVETVRAMMEHSAIKAAGVYDDALEAVHYITESVKCPCGCEHTFDVQILWKDWGTRLKAGEVVLKAAKVLKDVREVHGTVTHLSLEENIALQRMRRGLSIPPHIEAKFRERNLLPEGVPA